MKKSVFVILAVVLAVVGLAAGSFSGIRIVNLNPEPDIIPESKKTDPYARVADNRVYLFDGNEWIDSGDVDSLRSSDIFASYIVDSVSSDMPADMRTRTGVPVYTHSNIAGDYYAPAGESQSASPPSEPSSEWSDDFL